MFANQLQMISFCELGQVPLHLFWYKMLLQYVGRLVGLPNDRLVKQAFTHAQQQKTTWFQKLSSCERSCCYFCGMFCDSSDMNDALWMCFILLIQDVMLASGLWFAVNITFL